MSVAWKFAAVVLVAAVLDTPSSPPVRIDAVALDRQGRPVLDLRASDLEVRVNGVAQATHALELRLPPRVPAAAAHFPLTSREDEIRAAGQPGTRVFVFVLDEFHVSSGAPSDRVREAMTRFVDEHLRPSDMAAVFKPLDPVTTLRFTRDAAVLRQAVSSFAGRREDLAPRTAFEEQFIGHAPAAVTAARAQLMTVALTELSLHIGELGADRAAIVLVSEGFDRPASSTRRQGRLPDLQSVVRAASRFHFTLYAFNPADPAAAPAAAEQAPAANTLQWLARETGGSASMDGARLPEALARMSAELGTYYALTLQPGVSDGRFHQVQIVSKRAGVELRARPGFWAPLSSEVTALLERSTGPLAISRRALRRSPFIESWAGVVPGADGQARVVVSWLPAQAAGSKRPQPERVKLTARSESGTVLFEGTIAPIGSSGDAVVARFPAPAGRVEMDMEVTAADGAALDVELRDVSVPRLDTAKLPLLMPVEVVHARTMREYREMAGAEDAAPTPRRTFRRADRLILRVPAWSPEAEGLQITARVLNRRGQPIRPLEPFRWHSRGVMAFDFPLAWLAPGDYYLEVSARDSRGESRERLPIRIVG